VLVERVGLEAEAGLLGGQAVRGQADKGLLALREIAIRTVPPGVVEAQELRDQGEMEEAV